MKFRFAAKLTNLLKCALNALGSGGTALPGNLLLRVYPGFLTDCADMVSGTKFAITGTNGKSTTASILASILKANNRAVIYNSEGANMPAGIATTLAVGFSEAKTFDDMVIETDEAYLRQIFEVLNFDYLILTNLFEDQTDRHGSPQELCKKIQTAIDLNPNLKLVVNSDDPVLSELQGKKVTYSLRGGADYNGKAELFDDHIELKVGGNTFKINLKGRYNAYNALAAIAAALENGLTANEIQIGLDAVKPLYGRDFSLKINNKNVKLNLIKNTVGANEVIELITGNKILIAINNEFPDGRDFSWIYGTKFELLNASNNKFFVSGTKANEMAKHLQNCGVEPQNITVEPDLKCAVKLATNALEDPEELNALMVFTALAEFKNIF